MKKDLLATIIHISDLHFGKKLNMEANLFQKHILSKVPYGTGRFPHSYAKVANLSVKINKIIDKVRNKYQVPIGVILSGDVTKEGDDDEFMTANTFLKSSFASSSNKRRGLNLIEKDTLDSTCDPALFMIPGNHDKWDRSNSASTWCWISL